MDAYVIPVTRFLFVQSWQVALLAIVIGVTVYLLRHKSAHVRYLLWLIVLVKCLVPPLYPVKVAVLPQDSSEEWLVPFAASDAGEVWAADPKSSRTHTSVRPEGTIVPEMPTPISTTRLSLTPAEITVLVWLTGACVFLFWIVGRALRYTLWLRPRRRLLAMEQQDAFRELLAGMRSSWLPRIYVTKEIGQPFVWGLLRGSVYLPERFSDLDNLEQCRAVLSHELGHVARFDAALNLLQVLVQAFYWFHPLVWWVNRRIRVEREKCCDEMAVAQLELSPENYTGAIVEALAQEKRSVHPIPSLAIVGSLRDIEERIKTMMKPGKRFYRRPSVVVAMIVLALALITVPTALVLTVRAATEMDMVPPHRAAGGGDIADVEQWLAQGGDVNVKSPAGETLLRRALLGGRLDIIQLLQKHGADIDAEIQNDPSLIRQGATNGSPLVADYLISRGADTSHVYVAAYLGKLDRVKAYIESGSQQVSATDKYNILRGAITGGHADIIEYILDHGAVIKRYDLLFIAVRANRKQILELLIAKGADPNPGGGWSPLHITLYRYPRLEMAKVLLSHGADPYKEKGKGAWNPMHYAIDMAKKDMVKLFLDHSHNKDLLSYAYYALKWGHKDVLPLFEPYVEISPIHLSCFYGKLDEVKSYLENGNDIEAQGPEGLSLLQCAVLGSQMEIVDYLIAQGCNVNSKASDGGTALHCTGNKEMIQKLITAGALIEAKNNDDCTPFFYSTKGPDFGAAQVLLKHGADINIQRKSDGATALHEAASRSPYRRMKSMAWLIAQGADVNRRNKEGSTPLGVAMNRDRLDAVKYLLEHGADINCRDEDGMTPLLDAVLRHRLDGVQYLLEHGADVNCQDEHGRTPLRYAARWGHKESAGMLLEKDADITVQDSGGRTAMGLAKEHGYTETVELLSKRAKQLDPKREIMTICDYAAMGDTEKIRSLIAAGQDANSKRKNYGLALAWASMMGHREAAELLIQNGADVNFQSQSFYGVTPLGFACHWGRKEVVELLLANGADINVKNEAGKTLLEVASERKHTEIVELLKKHGAK
ncbi:ankyrin repeat domain-containing protein [Planctomycetota bacterium]